MSLGAALLSLLGLGLRVEAPPVGPICLDAGSDSVQPDFSGLRVLAAGDRADDGTVWNEICRSGTHLSPVHEGRVVHISRLAIEEMVETFPLLLADGWHAAGRGVPLRADPDHSMGWFGRDGALLAAGEILELETADLPNGEVSLLARIKWTPTGAKLVADGELWTTSIEFWPPGRLNWRNGEHKGHPITKHVMTGCVLTNDPMVSNMQPIAASWRADSSEPATPEPASATAPAPVAMAPGPAAPTTAPPSEVPPAQMTPTNTTQENLMGLKALILTALALSENATEQDIATGLATMKSEAERASTLDKNVETLSADRDRLKAENKELLDWKAEQGFKLAVDQGRCTLSEKELYLENVERMGEEKAHLLFTKDRVKVERRSPIATSTVQDEGGEGSDDQVAKLAAKFQADENLSEFDAFNKAMAATFDTQADPAADYRA